MFYVCCGITLLKTELTTDVTASSSCLQHYSVSSWGYGHCTVVFFTEVQSNNSKNWHSTNNLWFSKCVEVFEYLTWLFIVTVLVILFTVTYREMNACIIWHNQLPKKLPCMSDIYESPAKCYFGNLCLYEWKLSHHAQYGANVCSKFSMQQTDIWQSQQALDHDFSNSINSLWYEDWSYPSAFTAITNTASILEFLCPVHNSVHYVILPCLNLQGTCTSPL